MDYLRLSSALRKQKLYLFTLGDIKHLFPEERVKTIKNNLTRWITKGYLIRLRKDAYELIDKGRELEIPDLYVANRLYGPSYVSLETALSIYSIIPDIAAGVTSVTIRPTRAFKNKYGLFLYKSCRQRAFSGYRLILYEGFKVYIADKEKALVDFLYYRLRLNHSLDFGQERLNKKILRKIDWKKAYRYVKLFDKKTAAVLKKCKEYAEC